MKAAFVDKGKIKIVDVPPPEASEGEVVIRVEYALTDGTDLKALLRGHPLIGNGPFGHEYTGVVVDVGAGVRFKVGDEVVGANTGPCYTCRMCRRGMYNLCEKLSENMVLGAYAEYLKIPAAVVRSNLYIRPKDLPKKYAPMIEPLACVINGVENLNLRGYERALVIGTGSIASFFILLFRLLGHEVAVLGRNREKLSAISENLNPDSVLTYDDDIGKYDVVVEATGKKEVWENAIKYSERGGKVLLFGGLPSGTSVSFDAHRIHYDNIHILTSFHHTPTSVKRALQVLKMNWEKLAFLISNEYPLENIEEAFRLMSEGKGFKYAIRP